MTCTCYVFILVELQDPIVEYQKSFSLEKLMISLIKFSYLSISLFSQMLLNFESGVCVNWDLRMKKIAQSYSLDQVKHNQYEMPIIRLFVTSSFTKDFIGEASSVDETGY